MWDMERNELKAMFRRVRFTAKQGRTTGMLVNKLWERLRADNWEAFSLIESSLCKICSVTSTDLLQMWCLFSSSRLNTKKRYVKHIWFRSIIMLKKLDTIAYNQKFFSKVQITQIYQKFV